MNKEPKIASLKPWLGELEPGKYYWCACGESKNQPFCDGSHEGSGFSPLEFEVKEKDEYYLCTCKRTLSKPFCDGMHKRLRAEREKDNE